MSITKLLIGLILSSIIMVVLGNQIVYAKFYYDSSHNLLELVFCCPHSLLCYSIDILILSSFWILFLIVYLVCTFSNDFIETVLRFAAFTISIIFSLWIISMGATLSDFILYVFDNRSLLISLYWILFFPVFIGYLFSMLCMRVFELKEDMSIRFFVLLAPVVVTQFYDLYFSILVDIIDLVRFDYTLYYERTYLFIPILLFILTIFVCVLLGYKNSGFNHMMQDD
ncbi:MAG: hypothetical protein JW725_00775 [Candidatus Babeliaceae bacterium]|nr:hypothetical protein [Candidatus Babeliaceae bacterium]